jgi:hypothetical protein
MRNMQANPVHIVIGDRVTILPGAKILAKSGTLTIGEGSIIGANSVVLSDVLPNSIVTGVPGRSMPKWPFELSGAGHRSVTGSHCLREAETGSHERQLSR